MTFPGWYYWIPYVGPTCSDRCAKGGNCVAANGQAASALFVLSQYLFGSRSSQGTPEYHLFGRGEPLTEWPTSAAMVCYLSQPMVSCPVKLRTALKKSRESASAHTFQIR
jgi:hypothetical protein